MYLGTDQGGRQLWHWIGRFERKRDRDAAVAKARTEKPWELDRAPEELTSNEWADRFLARMESGALRTKSGDRFKDSSILTARSSLKAFREEFGDRVPRTITRVEAEDWAAKVPPSKLLSPSRL